MEKLKNDAQVWLSQLDEVKLNIKGAERMQKLITKEVEVLKSVRKYRYTIFQCIAA